MRSAVAKGSYWKARTVKWLEARGYQVAYLERMFFIYTPKGQIATKRDQFASDLLAMNGDEIVFVQVKGGESRRDGLAAARRKFAAFAFPPPVVAYVEQKYGRPYFWSTLRDETMARVMGAARAPAGDRSRERRADRRNGSHCGDPKDEAAAACGVATLYRARCGELLMPHCDVRVEPTAGIRPSEWPVAPAPLFQEPLFSAEA